MDTHLHEELKRSMESEVRSIRALDDEAIVGLFRDKQRLDWLQEIGCERLICHKSSLDTPMEFSVRLGEGGDTPWKYSKNFKPLRSAIDHGILEELMRNDLKEKTTLCQ